MEEGASLLEDCHTTLGVKPAAGISLSERISPCAGALPPNRTLGPGYKRHSLARPQRFGCMVVWCVSR